MVEIEFERRLERLFAEAPELPDAGAFAARVERRLDAVSTGTDWMSAVSSGGAVVWAAAAMAVVMMGFVLTRVIGEI